MRARRALAAALLLAVTGCATATVDLAKLPRMGVDFSFAARHKCRGVSPEIRLARVPAGVASYEVRMTDLDAPSSQHWQQTLPATGGVIRENAAGTRYQGPCPPSGMHRYRIEVIARDARDTPIGYGTETVSASR